MAFCCCCLCGEETRADIRAGVERFAARNGQALELEWFRDNSALFHRLQSGPPCSAAVVALPGALGMEAATGVRERAPGLPLVWCSDDAVFAVHSYRLKAAMFLKLPVRPEQVSEALDRCLEQRDDPCKRPRRPDGTRAIYREELWK